LKRFTPTKNKASTVAGTSVNTFRAKNTTTITTGGKAENKRNVIRINNYHYSKNKNKTQAKKFERFTKQT
jgi:hypothetical protein